MRIVGLLLAAGRGARFGGSKLLAPLPSSSHGVSAGTPIGVAATMHMMSALNDVVAVVRPGDSMLHDALAGTGASVVVCECAAEGMGASLACGVAAALDADGWIVALGDMPWIAPTAIAAVADAIKAGAEIAAPSYRGERGHPVGFAQSYGRALSTLGGDEGARTILAARQWAVRVVEVDDPGVIRDVDQPEDLR
jgi:molybdenum cofactor cytidylyltransferase